MSSKSPVDNFDYNKAVESIENVLEKRNVLDFAIFIHKDPPFKKIHIRVGVEVVNVSKIEDIKEYLSAELQEIRYMGLNPDYYEHPHINLEFEVKQ